ncbi:MAG: hypothetical protein E4H13_06035 [Calditrichales bacterium]|nr:MAG: hypothetical protein E4H13_06035 [Calditrichales bacterium]
MKKIIIGIHGLGNKPAKLLQERWWRKSISEGFRKCHIPIKTLPFELVYWADIIHSKSLKQWIKDPENPLYIEEPYHPGKKQLTAAPVNMRSKIYKYIESQLDKIFLNEDMTLNFAGVTDKIIHRYFGDLELYYAEDPATREAICQRLRDQLQRYKGYDIMLIAHSMGSIIGYDVLTRLSGELKISTFVTIGSPLGLPVITSRMFDTIKSRQAGVGLVAPESIEHKWYNLSDEDDHVALDHTLADDYAKNSRGIGAIDILVHNDYEISGKRNPHKSYGYLRTPELIGIIRDFLADADVPFISKTYHSIRNFIQSGFDLIKKKR